MSMASTEAPAPAPRRPGSRADAPGHSPPGGPGVAAPVRALFLGSTYAGHASRFADLARAAREHPRLDARFATVTGWKESGCIERLPLPRGLRGRIRAVAEAGALLSRPRPQVAWTSCREELLPFAQASRGPLYAPIVLDIDATDGQLEQWAPYYFGRLPRSGPRARVARLQERLAFGRIAAFSAWSEWAAGGLLCAGVDPAAIRVIPPGVDLESWKPSPQSTDDAGPLRLLFVGGDFRRKGGDLLVAAARTLGDRVSVEIVTRDDPGPLPRNVCARRADRDELPGLMAWADLFVMPTRAECFGIATVEAMAAGLPVVVGDRGAAREIVEHGVSGLVIEPGVADTIQAISALAADRARRTRMAAAARLRAEARFERAACAGRVLELVLETAEARPSAAGRGDHR